MPVSSKRKDGWEWLLANKIDKERDHPFEWGTRDCALWAADCVLEITGIDYAAPFRGRYNTEAKAKELINGQYGGLAAYTDMHLPQTPVSKAMRGDVVMWNNALGICYGAQSFFVTYRGLTAIKTSACEKAWRVE